MTLRDRAILFFIRHHLVAQRTGNEMMLEFTGITLERIDPTHPLSGLRIARDVRNDGLVEFECISRAMSRYKIKAVHLARIADDLKKRKARWTKAELMENTAIINEAFREESVGV